MINREVLKEETTKFNGISNYSRNENCFGCRALKYFCFLSCKLRISAFSGHVCVCGGGMNLYMHDFSSPQCDSQPLRTKKPTGGRNGKSASSSLPDCWTQDPSVHAEQSHPPLESHLLPHSLASLSNSVILLRDCGLIRGH